MLFYGPPGTGKTSTILALAKELYGPELMKSRVLELNASDERGISIVREKVKDFARMQLTNPPPGYKEKYPCPPFKIIVLDEADSMTQDAQSALRRTMETYSKITRFCLICNNVTRNIDPLASRSSKFRFKSIDQGNAKKRLEEIAEKEGVPLEDGAVDALIKCSEGDLRKAITFLQSAARLVGANVPGHDADGGMDIDKKAVTVKIIEDIAGVIPDETINHLIRAIRSRGDTYQAVTKVVEDMVADGWSAGQVLGQVRASFPFFRSTLDAVRVLDTRMLTLTVTAISRHSFRRDHPRCPEEQDRSSLLRDGQASGRRGRRTSLHIRSGPAHCGYHVGRLMKHLERNWTLAVRSEYNRGLDSSYEVMYDAHPT